MGVPSFYRAVAPIFLLVGVPRSLLNQYFPHSKPLKSQQGRVQAIFEGGPTVKFADKIAKICRQIIKDLPTEFFSVGLET